MHHGRDLEHRGLSGWVRRLLQLHRRASLRHLSLRPRPSNYDMQQTWQARDFHERLLLDDRHLLRSIYCIHCKGGYSRWPPALLFCRQQVLNELLLHHVGMSGLRQASSRRQEQRFSRPGHRGPWFACPRRGSYGLLLDGRRNVCPLDYFSDPPTESPAYSRKACSRHSGNGLDGRYPCLLITAPPGAVCEAYCRRRPR